MYFKTGYEVESAAGDHYFDTGFQPVALVILKAEDTETYNGIVNQSVSFVAGSAVRTHELSINTGSTAFTCSDSTTQVLSGVTFVSFDECGFTLNWSGTGSRGFFYMAFGGSDCNAAVGTMTTVASGTSDMVVSGLGFEPNFLMTNNGVLDWARAGYGMSSGPSNSESVEMFRAPFASFQTNFKDYVACPGNGRYTLNSFDADGFTLGVAQNVGVVMSIFYLAIGDSSTQFYVGSDSQKTSTGTKATTGVGFQPTAGFFLGNKRTATGSDTTSQTDVTLGATDGDLSFAQWYGSTTLDDNDRTTTGIVISNAIPTTTLESEASLSSFDADGFTLDWTTADATARLFGFAVFQHDAAPPCPFVAWMGQIYRRIPV